MTVIKSRPKKWYCDSCKEMKSRFWEWEKRDGRWMVRVRGERKSGEHETKVGDGICVSREGGLGGEEERV